MTVREAKALRDEAAEKYHELSSTRLMTEILLVATEIRDLATPAARSKEDLTQPGTASKGSRSISLIESDSFWGQG